VAALTLAGCSPRHGVAGDAVVPALKSTGYRFAWRRAPRPPGVERVVAGRATDADGASLDFAIAIYHGDPNGQPLPVVAHATGGISCANYTVIDNVGERSASGSLSKRRISIDVRLEEALKRQTRGYVCEG
jgi:hypothetical protein